MKRLWITLLALSLAPASLDAQSQLSRQLQQKLSNRKSASTAPQKVADDVAPSESPQVQTANFQPESPKEFAEAMHLAVLSDNLDAFNGMVSWATIVGKATSNLAGKPIDEFRTSFMKEIKSRGSLGFKIISTVNAGGSYEFLQLRKNKNTVVALFRMLMPGGKGVNYHEFALAKTKDGKVVASDIYVYLNGETLSQTLRRNLVSALNESDQKPKITLAGSDKLLSENVSVIEKLNQALADKDAGKARDQILKLPAELRRDKAIQAMTLNIYNNSSSFATVLEGVRKACPDDVFMDMIAIDILVRQKKFEEAINAIERINTKVGGDPFLKILHGRMLLNLGEEEDGRQKIQEAVSEDNGILSGYWNLVSFSLKDQDHEKTLELLKKIHQRFKISFKDLREIPSYKNFVESDQFELWQKYLETAEVSAPSTEPSTDKTSSRNARPANRTASQQQDKNDK